MKMRIGVSALALVIMCSVSGVTFAHDDSSATATGGTSERTSRLRAMRDELKQGRAELKDKAKELTNKIKDNVKDLKGDRKDFKKEHEAWVYYVGTADIASVHQINETFTVEQQAMVKLYTATLKQGTSDIQTVLNAWKTATLSLVTRKWDAIRPYVDADKLTEFEALLVERKALIEKAFIKRTENKELKDEKKNLRATLMVTNVEKMWNRVQDGSTVAKARFAKSLDRLLMQVDKILARSTLSTDTRVMREGVKTKLESYKTTSAATSSATMSTSDIDHISTDLQAAVDIDL